MTFNRYFISNLSLSPLKGASGKGVFLRDIENFGILTRIQVV